MGALLSIYIIFAILFLVIVFCKSESNSSFSFYVTSTYEQATKEELNEEWDYWKRSCGHLVNRFLQCYKVIEDSMYQDSVDVNEIISAKIESLELFQTINAKSYEILRYSYTYVILSKYLGRDFKPFMSSLSEYRTEIEFMAEFASIGKKRDSICAEIVNLLNENDIMRCKISKMKICGATKEQISCCCAYLLKNNIIVEYKNESVNRWFYKLNNKTKLLSV